MKDAYYFTHDCNARNDVKILKLRRILGASGYGLFWMLIEVLRESQGYKLPITVIKELSFDFRESEELILSVIKDFGLFTISDDYFFFSDSLNRRMIALEIKRQKLSEAGKRGRAKQLQIETGEEITALPGPPPGSKVKESKVKESKEYYSDIDLNTIFKNYLEMRVKIKKPATDKAIELAKTTLEKLAPNNDSKKIELLEQSILNSWQGIFPLRQNLTNEAKKEDFSARSKYPDSETIKRDGYDR